MQPKGYPQKFSPLRRMLSFIRLVMDLTGDSEPDVGARSLATEELPRGSRPVELPPHLRRIERNVREARFAPYTVTVAAQDIAKFATAIGADDPVYFDAAAAKELVPGARGILAPRPFHISIGTARGRILPRSDYGEDGLPAVERLADARLVVGGSKTDYFDEIYAGDEITVEQEVTSIEPRLGRSGPMLFVDLVRSYRLRDGGHVVVDHITQIFR